MTQVSVISNGCPGNSASVCDSFIFRNRQGTWRVGWKSVNKDDARGYIANNALIRLSSWVNISAVDPPKQWPPIITWLWLMRVFRWLRISEESPMCRIRDGAFLRLCNLQELVGIGPLVRSRSRSDEISHRRYLSWSDLNNDNSSPCAFPSNSLTLMLSGSWITVTAAVPSLCIGHKIIRNSKRLATGVQLQPQYTQVRPAD